MNIWLVNHYAISPQQAGGTRHYTLARELVQRGHQVTIIASSFDHTTRREAHLHDGSPSRLEAIDGVRFMWLRTPPYTGNSARRLWNTVVFSRNVLKLKPMVLGGKPDVIVGSSPHLFAAWAAERQARRHEVPFVFEVRDLWPQSLIDLGSFSESHPFVRMLERIERSLYRQSSRIITLLPGAGEHISQKGGDIERIVWIPNGVDLRLLPPPSPPQEDGVLTLMYAGAHGLANNLDVILDAAKIILDMQNSPQVQFRLVGDGPDKGRLIRKAKDLKLKNLIFEPPVAKDRIYDLMREADVFLLTLQNSPLFRWGVSPNKLFDYMAMARPIIFSVDTPFDPVKEARAGVSVPAGDPHALAEAVVSIANMTSEERWEMGLRGRAYVEKNHNVPVLANRFEQVLIDAIKMRVSRTKE
ncbi:MAG: glycosyltransferase family 4 protein [Candidatus Diapherotrites archaeon]|nr:glycosyltransferase family 4 protein [Candidatus Diapherotrites archaeon]